MGNAPEAVKERASVVAPSNDEEGVTWALIRYVPVCQTMIRPAHAGDTAYIAALCQQLGYPASQEEVQRRLEQIQPREDHAVYVAGLPDGRVVGWIHVCVRHLVVADLQAEIEGLVVAEGYRRCGVGYSNIKTSLTFRKVLR